jgi:RNA polymerase sigma factor (sigma-70 family)
MKHGGPDDEAKEHFVQLYAETRVGILGFLMRRTENPSDAADLLAESYLIAWRRIEDVPRGEQARLWLYGVARRVLSNYRRHEEVEDTLAERLKSDLDRYKVGSRAVDSPFGEVIEESIRNLDAVDREIIELSAWEELSPSEIATVVGMNAGTVRVRLHRVRKALGVTLTEAGYVPTVRQDRAG